MANLAQGSSNSSSCLHQSSKVWIVALWHYWLCSCTTAVIIMNITVNNVKIIENLTFAEAASLLPRSPMVISPQRFKFGQLSKESLVVCHDKSFLFSLQQHDKKTNTIEGKKKLDPPLLYVLCSSNGLFWLQAVLVCLARGVHLRRIYSKYFKYVKIQILIYKCDRDTSSRNGGLGCFAPMVPIVCFLSRTSRARFNLRLSKREYWREKKSRIKRIITRSAQGFL